MANLTESEKACKECKHAIFDEIWGEYKCEILKHKIYHPIAVDECLYFEKGNPQKSKFKPKETDN